MSPKKREDMTEEEKEKARAKDKKRRWQKKENMTEEQREAVRAKDRERRLQIKANMTEEEKRKERENTAIRVARKRAIMTEEEKRKEREKTAARTAQKRAIMTEEEKQKEREKTAARMAKKRAIMIEKEIEEVRAKEREIYLKKRADMTEEEIEEVRAKERELYLKKRADMTEEEKQKVREKTAVRMAQRRAIMTEEEREAVRAKERKRGLKKRANMTEEEKQKRRTKTAKRINLYLAASKRTDDRSSLPSMTPVQRVKSLISRVTISSGAFKKNEAAKAYIKTSLLEIVSLHEELGQLKMQLQKTLAEAVASAVKLRISEKCKTAELHVSTFVEIPISLAADKITTFNNLDDPLLLKTGKEFHPEKLRLSSENVDQQNENDKIFHPGFQVFAHAFVADNKSECTNTIKELTCPICSKNFGTSIGLTIHQREHSVDSNEFTCSICSKVFYTYKLMSTHYLQAHSYEFCDNEMNEETDDEFKRSLYEMDFVISRECFICFKFFGLGIGLTVFRNHVIDHHSDNKELLKYYTYICCRCDKPHAAMRSLQSHWETTCFQKWKNEDKTNNNKIICEQCGSKLSNEKSLSSHIEIFHKAENIVCETCGNQFKNQSTLHSHIKWTHRAQYKFICEHCSKKFKTGFCLKEHKERVHLRVKSFVCKFCSKRLSNRYTWIAHEKIHTGERPYECKVCKKSFVKQSSLKNHQGIHTGYKCKNCDTTFSSYMDICEHRRLNHPNPNNRSSELSTSCTICLKSFKTYMLLRLHKRNVHENRKYVCDICGKVFKSYCTRNSHRISHDNLIRYGCNLCKSKFRHSTNFYKHRKVAHVNENAQIVKLVSKTILPSSGKELDTSKQMSNLECSNKLELEVALQPEQNSNAAQKSIATSQAENKNSPQQSETTDISKTNLELDNSPALDDYFSDVEFDNQDSQIENYTTQFEIAELKDASPDLANAVFNSHKDKDASNFDDLNDQNSDQSIQSILKSSVASVPLGFSELCDEASTHLTKQNRIDNKESKNQHQVFIEDIEDAAANFLLANVNMDDLVKLKTEKIGEPVDETSIDRTELHSDDNIGKNDHQENSKKMDMDGKQKQLQFSPSLVVKLTRLLEFSCVPCDKTIFAVSEREIRIHRRTHRTTRSQNEEIVIRKIKKCSSNKSDVEMKGSYNCLYCDQKGYVRCYELVIHCSKKHPGKKPLKCQLCPEMFACYKTLREHKLKSHDSNKKKSSSNKSDVKKWFKCLYCENKSFVNGSALIDHCSNKHPGKEPLRCKMCPEMFTSIKTWREHKAKVHDSTVGVFEKGRNEFLCELCGKKFNLRANAITHFLHNHQERKFKCDVCSKSFPTVKELERHQLRHLSTKPHLCENCGKAFFTPHELTDHIEVVHRKIYKRKRAKKCHPFSCNICPYKFKKKSGLKAHLELHDPKRKFACDECGLRYKFYTNVITHKNYKHRKNGKRNIGVTSDDN